MIRSQITSPLISAGFQIVRSIERFVPSATRLHANDLRSARRFLFLEYSPALGTNVHTTPLLEALKNAVPDAVTMVACSQIGFEVLKHNPFVDYLVETPRPPVSLLQAVRSMREHLKATGFAPEVIITSKGNAQRSIALLALLARPSIRLGYTLAPELYDIALSPDVQQSLIDNNLRVIERLGYPKESPEPRVAFSPEDLEHARALLRATDFDSPRVAFITQTSPTQRKSWPVDRFINVVNYVTQSRGGSAVFLGTSQEAGAIETIREKVRGANVSLAGKTTISQVAAVLSLCDYAVTLDTGNMHIGRAVGLPMVILAPAWQPVVEWLPLGFNQYRILKGTDIPCATPDYVMDEMSVEDVFAQLEYLFVQFPASTQSRERRIIRSMSRVSSQSRRQIRPPATM